ncbi:MAG: hypothetical protein COA99_02060 [Moraxellaceae bacterium]|nr:MAG: hypothetical protein COA99_02060 [Moraxellaceae bacterium]
MIRSLSTVICVYFLIMSAASAGNSADATSSADSTNPIKNINPHTRCIMKCRLTPKCVEQCKIYEGKPYPGLASFVRTSQLTSDQKRQLILDNMPIWIMSADEDYFPKSFKEYLWYDVKLFNPAENSGPFHDMDLIAYDDTRHQKKNGKYNTVKLADNLITGPINFDVKDESNRTARSMDPKAAPTYAFYLETNTGEIWVRYFLFFGYNKVPWVGGVWGNHFSDWIHVSVKLTKQGADYIPSQYYFSAHKKGKLWDSGSTSLGYYVSTGPQAYKEVEFEEAKVAKQYHVGVYAANGTHEAYATIGKHKTTVPFRYDYTDFGAYIVDPNVRENNPNAKTNSKLNHNPIYAWDMGKAYKVGRDNVESGKHVKSHVQPWELFNDFGSWVYVWYKNDGYLNFPIMSSGQKVSVFDKGGAGDAPSGKIISWGNDFEK